MARGDRRSRRPRRKRGFDVLGGNVNIFCGVFSYGIIFCLGIMVGTVFFHNIEPESSRQGTAIPKVATPAYSRGLADSSFHENGEVRSINHSGGTGSNVYISNGQALPDDSRRTPVESNRAPKSSIVVPAPPLLNSAPEVVSPRTIGSKDAKTQEVRSPSTPSSPQPPPSSPSPPLLPPPPPPLPPPPSEHNSQLFVSIDDSLPNPAVVILAHNRPDKLITTLSALLQLEDVSLFKVYVSCDDPKSVGLLKKSLSDKGLFDRLSGFWESPPPVARTAFQRTGVFKIAAHFKAVMDHAFPRTSAFTFATRHSHLVLLEDDLLPAPDFLSFFRATAWLLDEDPTLWCVSAWNDNGQSSMVNDPQRLFRTSYFPGLGWMLKASMWDGLRDRWPEAATTGWDHWIRLGPNRDGKECIGPEIPRTRHLEGAGTNVQRAEAVLLSKYELSSRRALPLGHLRPIKGTDATGEALLGLPPSSAPSSVVPDQGSTGFGDVSYLLSPRYERLMQRLVEGAIRVDSKSLPNRGLRGNQGKAYLLPYIREEYTKVATAVGAWKQQARGIYNGIVVVRRGRDFIVLADRRSATTFLRPDEIRLPSPSLRLLPAAQAQSCTDACRKIGLRCMPDQLEVANRCEALQEYFPCEGGCGHQIGFDIPCYVHDIKEDTSRQCLVTDGAVPTCDAHHQSTTRLCACGR